MGLKNMNCEKNLKKRLITFHQRNNIRLKIEWLSLQGCLQTKRISFKFIFELTNGIPRLSSDTLKNCSKKTKGKKMEKNKKNQKKVVTKATSHRPGRFWIVVEFFSNINFSFYDRPFLTEFQKEWSKFLRRVLNAAKMAKEGVKELESASSRKTEKIPQIALTFKWFFSHSSSFIVEKRYIAK